MASITKSRRGLSSGLQPKAINKSSIVILAVCAASFCYFRYSIYRAQLQHEILIPDGTSSLRLTFCPDKGPPQRSDSSSKELRSNSRFTGDRTAELIIRDATLFDGDQWHDEHVDILVKEGIIQKIGHSVQPSGTWVTEVFAHGRPVTPGLVVMHSHM